MDIKKIVAAVGLATILFSTLAVAQSGGQFTITKSVIAGGGGQSSGGQFTIDGTIGQSIAGTSSTGGQFDLTGGFWGGVAAPASSVTVSGRVLTPSGLFLRNAIVTMTDPSGVPMRVTTSSAGFFQFDNVTANRTYIFGVSSKRYRFAAQILLISSSVTNMEFRGLE